jgi:aldehyde dehydrogenase
MERQRILLEIAHRIEKRAKDYAAWESQNVGKPIRESSFIDVPFAVDHFRYFAGVLRNLQGTTQSFDPSMLHLTLREPLGVVGHILPWNFPLLLLAWKLAPSLAAGNTVVMKPAEQTPVNALELAYDLRDLLPRGLQCHHRVRSRRGCPLASHPGVRKLSFTGETTTGRLILQYASRTSSPLPWSSAGRARTSSFPTRTWSGPSRSSDRDLPEPGTGCSAGSRLFVHDAIYDSFMEKLIAKVKAIKIGDPMKEDTQPERSSPREQMEKVLSTSRSGRRRSDRPVRGTRITEPGLANGYFVAPTILGNVKTRCGSHRRRSSVPSSP